MVIPSKITKLAEMQRNFISDCLSGKLTKDRMLKTRNIDNHLISDKGLMGIYQNSAIANITQSLSLTYPVIEKLVGGVFFRATCRQFIHKVWPKSGNMDDYGVEFSEFLAKFEHTKELVYLEDVARLEWAFNKSSLADSASITDWSTLALVSDILQLQFILSPSYQLIRSAYPIDKIWQLNNEDLTHIEMDLSQKGGASTNTFLVLARQELKTVILPITFGEFEFLQCLDQGKMFEQAITSATLKQVDFSVDDSLRKFIEQSIITGFS